MIPTRNATQNPQNVAQDHTVFITLSDTDRATLNPLDLLVMGNNIRTLVGVTLGTPGKATIEATLQNITVTWGTETFTCPMSPDLYNNILNAVSTYLTTEDERPLQETMTTITAAVQPQPVSADTLAHFVPGLPLLAVQFQSILGTTLVSAEAATRNGQRIVPDGDWDVWTWPTA